MAKLTADEVRNIRGEEAEALLRNRKLRLSTSPFGAMPGKVIAYISKAVPWKKRGRVPKKLHLA